MKWILRNSLSDYLFVEVLAVVLAAVMIGSVTAYVSADSIYKASIMGGTVTPILGAPGQLSGQSPEKPPEYYAEQYLNIKERIASLFGKLVWSNSSLLSAVYAIGVLIALFPFAYRMRVSFVPLLFRERTGPVSLVLKGFALSLGFLLPLFASVVMPLVMVKRNWLSGIEASSLLMLAAILLSLLLLLTVAVYSTYILWGRVDLALVFTLLLAFGLSGKLGFEWRSVWVYLGASLGILLVMVIAAQRRLMRV